MIAEDSRFGFACHCNNVAEFTTCVDKMLLSDIPTMGQNAYQFLCDNYSVEHTYSIINKHIK